MVWKKNKTTKCGAFPRTQNGRQKQKKKALNENDWGGWVGDVGGWMDGWRGWVEEWVAASLGQPRSNGQVAPAPIATRKASEFL